MEEKKFVDRNIIHGGDKNFYIPILISFLAVYLAGRYIDQTIFDFTSVGGLGLIIFYALRFSKKDNRKFIDFLKLILISFFCLSVVGAALDIVPFHFVPISFVLLYFVYLLDRLILNARKKFSLLLSGIFALMTMFFVVYGQIQTDLAKERKAEANVLRDQAIGLTEILNQQAADAKNEAAKAAGMEMRLKECQDSK